MDLDPVPVRERAAVVSAARTSSDARSARIYLLSRSLLRGIVRRGLSIVALVVLDIAGLAIGLYLALVLRTVVYGDQVYWSLLWRDGASEWLPFLAPITVLVFFQARLYAAREYRPGPGRIVSSLILVALVVLSFGIGTGYTFNTSGLIPTAVVVCSVTIGVLRAAYGSLALEVMRLAGVRRRIVLVGEGESLERLNRELEATRGGVRLQVVGSVSNAPAEPGSPRQLSFEALAELLERERPDELILTEADFDERSVLDVVRLAHRHGVRVRLAPHTTDLLIHEGEYIPGQGLPLFELRPPILTGWDFAVKRVFDVVVAAGLLVVGLPIWLLIAAAIKLGSKGPVFFVDHRVGVAERSFGMLKFRTMDADAADRQAALEQDNEASGALFKIREDPRVTGVGRILRRFSIDELPQLINVVRGQMSLVGPRPLPLRDYELLEEWHRARYLVLPGMTGLWQISGRSGLSFDDLVRLDFTYLENWSIWLDISIIVKTIPAVITGRGAY